MTEQRCQKCNLLLCKLSEDSVCTVEIKCRKCGTVNEYIMPPDGADILSLPPPHAYGYAQEVECH